MGGVGMAVRSALRHHWRGVVVITVLVGLAGTVVLATVAGARRTATTLDRFTAYSRSADIEISALDAAPEQIGALRREPEVAAVAELHQMNLLLPDGSFLPAAAAVDGRFGTVVDRPRILEGRLPRPSAPLELAIGETLAQRLHVGVGDTATFHSYSKAQTDLALAENTDPGPPTGPVVHFRVVAVVRRPLDLGVRGGPGGVVVPTPAFLKKYGDKIGNFSGQILRVRTRGGAADVAAVVTSARRIFGRSAQVGFTSLAIESEGARDAIDVLTVALWVFAGVAALAGAVAIAIVTSRQIGSEDRDQAVLAALGFTRLQRAAAAAAMALPAAIGGAALAVVGAALASPLLPFGVARKAEIDPGFRIDGLALGLGFLALLAFVLLVAAVAGLRVARSAVGGRARTEVARPSAAARVAAGAGFPPTVTTGLRMALEPGRGRTAVPVRSAFTGAVLGTLGIVAVLIFSSSLTNLVDSPRLYGWSFDAELLPRRETHAGRLGLCDDVNAALVGDREFSALGDFCTLNVEVDGRPTQGWGFTSIRGPVEPTVVAGRAAQNDHEVALGAANLDALDKRIGDTVPVRADGGTKRFRIVGQVAFPSPEGQDALTLADGAAFTGAGVKRIVVDSMYPDTYNVARFASGVDPANLPKKHQGLGKGLPTLKSAFAILPTVPVEVERLRQVDQLPIILGALLGLLATAAVGHSIVVAVRRRRRDLAVLRTLGFERSQVRRAVGYQATAHAVLGLLVGIPLGVAVGRLVWQAIADSLGIESVISVPVLALVVVAVAAVLIVNVIGSLAARSAIRTRPATVLRTE
jgi:ABC-type lipoprotein release transport system permease subunit